MEVTRTASTSRGGASGQPSAQPTHRRSEADHLPHPKRHKPDVVAPSSPSKSKTLLQRQNEHARFIGRGTVGYADAEARRQAELLKFAESRAKAASSRTPYNPSEAEFRYPPGASGDDSARGLLEQIKNRMEQRNPSNFLQKAKQVQQSLLDKQQRAADIQRLREEAARRESFRSTGFDEEHALSSTQGGYAAASSIQNSVGKATESSQGAFARAKKRTSDSDADSDEDGLSDGGDYEHQVASDSHTGRDDDLALVESLQRGPRPIPPNPEDPKWQTMEPFSGHRLRERKLPHSQLKDYLRGRYHIPPSLLYSIARPITVATFADGRPLDWKNFRNGDYEVPVDGDFVIIATIVEKSDLLVTKGFDSESGNSRNATSGRKPASFIKMTTPCCSKMQALVRTVD